MHAAVARECRTVRTSVGMFDASTLGKIEVVGPDAGRFLDRMYLTSLARLAVGRSRYALQLNDTAFVLFGRVSALVYVLEFVAAMAKLIEHTL